MTTIGRTLNTSATAAVRVYDGTGGDERLMSGEQVAADKVAGTAAANAERVLEYLGSTFGRNGLDGKGAGLDLVVHAPEPSYFSWLSATGRDGHGRPEMPPRRAPEPMTYADKPMNNAYWDLQAKRMYVGDGDGSMFSPLGNALDIIAHEAGHAVLASELKMGFDGEQGALHESFGDVLGTLVDGDDWSIGEEALTPNKPGDALRDLGKPQRYSNVDQLRGQREPHLLADIPNLAAFRFAEKAGREALGKVWYEAFTEQLKDHATFTDAAAATVTAASKIYGEASDESAAVTQAWASVGVLNADGTPAPRPAPAPPRPSGPRPPAPSADGPSTFDWAI